MRHEARAWRARLGRGLAGSGSGRGAWPGDWLHL